MNPWTGDPEPIEPPPPVEGGDCIIDESPGPVLWTLVGMMVIVLIGLALFALGLGLAELQWWAAPWAVAVAALVTPGYFVGRAIDRKLNG